MKNNKQGFTLVELAIVLVIIGLLISSILIAQSMISNTRVQSFTRQISQYDAAVATFKDKFACLPGDLNTNLMGGTQLGDCDGIVANTGWSWGFEQSNFWTMLSTSGLKAGNDSVQIYTNSYLLGVGMPTAKVGKNTGVYPVGMTPLAGGIAMLDVVTKANSWLIVDCTASTSDFALSCSSGVSGNDAIAVDKKMDDGAGDTGNIAGADYSVASSWWDMVGDTEVAYTAGTDTGAYGLVIRMGYTSGESY